MAKNESNVSDISEANPIDSADSIQSPVTPNHVYTDADIENLRHLIVKYPKGIDYMNFTDKRQSVVDGQKILPQHIVRNGDIKEDNNKYHYNMIFIILDNGWYSEVVIEDKFWVTYEDDNGIPRTSSDTYSEKEIERVFKDFKILLLTQNK